MLVTVDDIEARFPRPLTPAEKRRAGTLIEDARGLIAEEFYREGVDLESRLKVPGFQVTFARVVRDLVAQALHLGGDVNRRSRQVGVGAINETTTWTDGVIGPWSGMGLTDEQRQSLGLSTSAHALGRFPAAQRWPERWR